ncbi:rRNA-binding ribosome biosynthesis protein utp25 [Diatrype stigma]|uniref:U3 small nucleolar RNA-associated protein 25 n=1 Tax=Diatrype stigma TaxID=117547 RepID=A0AAN9UZ29_9PEZI
MPSKKGPPGRRGPPPKGKGGPPKGKTGFRRGRFEKSRLADFEDLEDEASDDSPESEQDPSEDEDDLSEDEEDQGPKRPYLALMQSLAKDSAPQAKRRKVAHQDGESRSKPKARTEPEPEPEPELEDEDRDLDHVEEPEEDPEAEVEFVVDGDDDEEDTSDPFETHFAKPDQDLLQKRLKAVDAGEYTQTQHEQNGWRIVKNIPGKDLPPSKEPPTISGPSSLKLKQRLAGTANKLRPAFDDLEQVLYPLVFGYQDVLFCGRTVQNAENLRRMACLHAVNHVFKTRDRIIKNNAKLAREGEGTDFEPRDQGFTRPKVLMILPTRQSALKVVQTICALCEPDQQENRKRFDDAYADPGAKFGADRPEDFRELFEGNDDDMFRIGIKFTRKTIRYFAPFYGADVILASPLGLRMAIGSEEDSKKPVDYDFLSSVELVVVDQADALPMQNWEHVEYALLGHLNRQPRDPHGCDFSRVREWCLDGRAPNFRQAVVLAAFHSPELAELHRRLGGQNWAGRARVQPAEYPGAIQDLVGVGGTKIRQTFSRFEAASVADDPDARFDYFTSAVVPALTKRAGRHGGGGAVSSSKDAGGTLIFIPSYLDFVRVRNYFASDAAVAGLTFGAVSEYAGVAEASRARSHFLTGRHKVLLYTERAHHFRRYAIRGVRRVVFYGLPDNPLFYREIAGGYLAAGSSGSGGQGATTALTTTPTARAMFSRYDFLKLERVVGSKRVGKMIRERGDTFDFV